MRAAPQGAARFVHNPDFQDLLAGESPIGATELAGIAAPTIAITPPKDKEFAGQIRQRIDLYEQQQPYRDGGESKPAKPLDNQP